MIVTKVVRSATLGSLCALGMVLAHLLGGGELTLNWLAPFFLLLSVGVFYSLGSQEFSGPVLTSILLIFQMGGHLALGVSHSEIRMSFAHGIALLVSFHLVRHFEQIVSRVESFFSHLIILRPVNYPITTTIFPFSYRNTFTPIVFFDHIFERAPPLRAAL